MLTTTSFSAPIERSAAPIRFAVTPSPVQGSIPIGSRIEIVLSVTAAAAIRFGVHCSRARGDKSHSIPFLRSNWRACGNWRLCMVLLLGRRAGRYGFNPEPRLERVLCTLVGRVRAFVHIVDSDHCALNCKHARVAALRFK